MLQTDIPRLGYRHVEPAKNQPDVCLDQQNGLRITSARDRHRTGHHALTVDLKGLHVGLSRLKGFQRHGHDDEMMVSRTVGKGKDLLWIDDAQADKFAHPASKILFELRCALRILHGQAGEFEHLLILEQPRECCHRFPHLANGSLPLGERLVRLLFTRRPHEQHSGRHRDQDRARENEKQGFLQESGQLHRLLCFGRLVRFALFGRFLSVAVAFTPEQLHHSCPVCPKPPAPRSVA